MLLETQEFGRFFNFDGTGYPRLFDLSDERNPAVIGRYVLPGAETSTAHDPKIVGRRAYVSWYDFGVRVLDLSRPGSPRAWRTSSRGPDGTRRTRGAATARSSGEPFPNRDYFVATDMNTGLWVAKIRCVVPKVAGCRSPTRAPRSREPIEARKGRQESRGTSSRPCVTQRPRARSRASRPLSAWSSAPDPSSSKIASTS